MKSSISKVSALLTISSALLLSACGGGGGGDASSSQAASTITVANATDVSAQSYSASNSLNDQASGSADLVTGVSVETQKTGLINASVQHLYRALQAKPANLVVGVSGEQTEDCTGGGTMTTTYNVADVEVRSNGDTVTINSNNCVEGGIKLNGGLTISFSNLSGTPSSTGAWSATLKMTYTNLSITENGMTETVNGDLTLGYSRTSTGAETFSASGSSLQLSTAKNGGTVTTTLAPYSYSGSATATGLYTYRNDFTVSGNLPRLGSNVAYVVKTTKDFKQQGTNNPHEGVMTVTATDKTSLTFTVLSSTNVQIGVDKNGDGTIDETMTKTWAELTGLL